MKIPAPPAYLYCPLCGESLVTESIDGQKRLKCGSTDCPFVHWDNPVPVVAAIVEHEGDVILVRSKQWAGNIHGLVTGFLEKNEAPEQGVLREIQEELGLSGQIVSFVGHYLFEAMNQLLIAYHVRATGQIVLGDELASYKRIAPDKLRPWPMGTGHAVADWLATRSATG